MTELLAKDIIKVGTVVNLKDRAAAVAMLEEDILTADEVTEELTEETLAKRFVVIAHDEGWNLMCYDFDGDDTVYWLNKSWVKENTDLKASESIGLGERCF